MKHRKICLAAASVIALMVGADAANAAAIIQGIGVWNKGTPVTAFSAPGKSFGFTFEVPNPLDANPTTSFSNFYYQLSGTPVAAVPTGIAFYNLANDGLFDIFFGGTTVSLYGLDIGSTGSFTAPGVYFMTAAINNGLATGNGAVTLEITPSVPEPATWAMMIAGFGLSGAALRRSRKVTTKVAYA